MHTIHTLPFMHSHIHTHKSRTHTQIARARTHTQIARARTHTLFAHRHTLFAHTHTHTHTHAHTLLTHTHTQITHTHTRIHTDTHTPVMGPGHASCSLMGFTGGRAVWWSDPISCSPPLARVAVIDKLSGWNLVVTYKHTQRVRTHTHKH